MKISELENLIFKNSSKINIMRGRNLIEENSINIDVHKVNSIYNVYGINKSKNELKYYNSHLRIDIKNRKISFTKCSCSLFQEHDFKNKIYLCEHLVATGIKFIEDVKRKLNATKNEKVRLDKIILKELKYSYSLNNNEKNKIYDKREQLNINLSLKEVNEQDIKAFDISLYMGSTYMYPILNIRDCIISIKNKKEYNIGKGLLYDSKKYSFSENDEKLLNYLYEVILINKNENSKNSLRIPCEILRKFLENLDGKKIKFLYNYQNYLSDIVKSDLPLSFTMKKINENYVLTTKKVFPIPLNNSMDVFLYDRNLYIPSLKQINLYKILYKYFKKSKEITFKDDITDEEFNILNKVITSISENVFYDEAIIEKINKDIKIIFNFTRKRGKSICDVGIKSSIVDMEYFNAVKINKDRFNISRKLFTIESILNKYRFYYRNETFEFLGDDEEYYLFLKEGIDEINSIGNIFINQSYRNNFELYGGKFKEFLIKKNSKGMYDLHMQLENISKDELKDVVRAYKENRSFIKLDNELYIDLKNSEFEKIMRIIDSLNLNVSDGKDKYELSLDKLYYLKDKIENEEILTINSRKKLLELFSSLEKKQEREYELPDTLNCTLRDYQKDGYNWFKNLSELGLGGILSDEMGLGKTVQTIAFLASQGTGTSIIIVPTSLLYNWRDEFKKFAPDLNIGVVHGEKKQRENFLKNYYKYNVMLTTYGTLKNDYKMYEEIDFKNVILDEGQNIKNYKAQITQIVKKINGNNRFILTGTPIENNLNELWSLFDFILPGYLYTYKEFNEKFVNNSSNIEELKILIKPYILRRRKKDVAYELPKKSEKIVRVKMIEEQREIYDVFVKEIKNHIQDKNINNITIFSYLTKLRQLCLDPSIVSDEYKGDSCKIQEALNIIKNTDEKNKILLFSQFTSTLKKISKTLDKESIKYCYLDGSVSSVNRIKLVDEFNNNDEKKVFLISLKAGGTGLNLTSANMVIHFDPWWNPSIEEQATDRVHRIGQKKNVEVIKLISEDTIEEKIVLLQEDKRNLINDVLTNELQDTGILNAITSKELINLLK